MSREGEGAETGESEYTGTGVYEYMQRSAFSSMQRKGSHRVYILAVDRYVGRRASGTFVGYAHREAVAVGRTRVPATDTTPKHQRPNAHTLQRQTCKAHQLLHYSENGHSERISLCT